MKQLARRPEKLAVAVALVVALAALARIVAIGRLPEPDADAWAHLGTAKKLIDHPLQLNLHWVWLPGYHYYLMVLLRFGASPQGIRYLNTAFVALLPLLIVGYARPHARHPSVPWLAASFCAAAPIVNLLGISAQQETLFTLIVLGCAWAIDAGRFWLGGALLAAAALVRYEAWGAVALLTGLACIGLVPAVARRLPSFARGPRELLRVALPALAAVFGWILLHRVVTGKWFGFLRELYRFTKGQRAALSHGAWMDALWFPLLLPLFLFGLALPFALFGLRRAVRRGWLVPAGIALFLSLSYASKGSLGSGRYFDSLAPFVCLAAGEGIARIVERRPRALWWLGSATTLCLLALSSYLVTWTYRR
ncbi:MAG: hypothetical protein QM756_08440 [Polyangiaceae bacterium]